MAETKQPNQIFDSGRSFTLGDPELDLMGSRVLLAQWRHQRRGPAFYRLGRKIVYRGSDLNEWAQAQRVQTGLQIVETLRIAQMSAKK